MKKLNSRKLNFFRKIELVISHPHKFFDKVKKEKGMKNVFEFYFIFVFLSVVINTLFLLPGIMKDSVGVSITKYFLFLIVLIVFILALTLVTVGLSFVLYWFYHILIKIFKGKKKYPETYKLLYGATPLLLVLLIPIYGLFKIIIIPLLVIAALDALYIEYVGLQKLHKMNRHNAIAVLVVAVIIAVLSIFILNNLGWWPL